MAVTWMKTAPDKRTYQQEASSPWLEKKSSSIVIFNNSTQSDGGIFYQHRWQKVDGKIIFRPSQYQRQYNKVSANTASCKLKTSKFQSGDRVVKKVLTLCISMMTNKVV